MNVLNVVRWIHIISGVAWVGEVITLNFVIVPALIKMSSDTRGTFIRQIFPRVFHLASILSLTAIISGAAVNYLMTGWKNLDVLIGTRWGMAIAIGGGLALLLTLFHLFIEERLEPIAITADASSDVDIEKTIKMLKIIPRVGLPILLLIVLLMMYAARGL